MKTENNNGKTMRISAPPDRNPERLTRKTGIITILKVRNYGAELQAYALPKALCNMGCEAENIDYLYYKHPDYIAVPGSEPMVPVSAKDRVKRKIQVSMEAVSAFLAPRATKIKNARFEEFHRHHTSLSPDTYRSINELYAATFNYDLFMVGSDQVWNPSTLTSLKPYFLTFAPAGSRKVSYASSFGVSDIKEEYGTLFRECLNNLDHISTRENKGVEIVRRLTGRKASRVVDPTLLISREEWLKISIIPDEQKPYILLYVLTHSPYITALAKKLQKLTGYTIIRICSDPLFTRRNHGIRNITDAGPREFLGWFSKASLVLTNSFHGTCFPVIFQKPFFTIIPKGKTNNSRQRDFLELLKLETRLLQEGAAMPCKELLTADFSVANNILEEERRKSIRFLQEAING